MPEQVNVAKLSLMNGGFLSGSDKESDAVESRINGLEFQKLEQRREGIDSTYIDSQIKNLKAQREQALKEEKAKEAAEAEAEAKSKKEQLEAQAAANAKKAKEQAEQVQRVQLTTQQRSQSKTKEV